MSHNVHDSCMECLNPVTLKISCVHTSQKLACMQETISISSRIYTTPIIKGNGIIHTSWHCPWTMGCSNECATVSPTSASFHILSSFSHVMYSIPLSAKENMHSEGIRVWQ